MTCPLCGHRKARRACPALGQQICAVCCGTKRLVEISCPSDCVYLEAAERHPPAAVKRQQEQDLSVLMSTLGRLSQPQLQLFFLLQGVIVRFKPEGGLLRLVDRDVADAAGALASTLETAERGVVYEHQSTSPVAEELRRSLRGFLSEIGKGGGSRFEREAAMVLRGIERGARHEAAGLSDGESPYLALVGRVIRERPGVRQEPAAPPPASDEPRIVITG